MKSRAFVLVALLCALFLLVSSTLAADTPKDEKDDKATKEPDQAGGRCRYGCCGYGRYGCQRCCKTADEAEAAEVSVDVSGYGGGGYGGGGYGGGYGGGGYGGGYGGGGRGGGYGGGYGGGGKGGGGYGGGGHGGGGGYGGHCRYGCCGGGGRYCRCCYNLEEAKAILNEN